MTKSAMTESDPQLELKKRARRRLVGAIALALLAAVVLPMVMDQEPKTAAQDIQIRIPSQDAGSFTSRILPVKPGAVPTPLPSTAAPVAPAARPIAPETKPEAPKVEAAKVEAAQVDAPKPEPVMADPPAKQPELRASAPVDDKLLAKVAEKSVAKPAANGGGDQWIVQIGAYRDPANLRNLQAKLKEQGYNFYTEPLVSDGVRKTRLRAGPFPSKEVAEKARDRLKRIGVDGVVAQKQ